MSPIALIDVLAQAPDNAPFVSVGKLITMIVLFAVWCMIAHASPEYASANFGYSSVNSRYSRIAS